MKAERSATKVCRECRQTRPLSEFEGKVKAECMTCKDCRERRVKRRRNNGGPRLRMSFEGYPLADRVSLLGLPPGLQVRPARRRPGDRPGERWMEIV